MSIVGVWSPEFGEGEKKQPLPFGFRSDFNQQGLLPSFFRSHGCTELPACCCSHEAAVANLSPLIPPGINNTGVCVCVLACIKTARSLRLSEV